MEFGTFLLLQSPTAEPSEVVFGRGVEITQAADELGFRNMWLAEHHFSTYGYLSRPLTFALHLANKTKRLRVGTAVIVLPLHHPLIVAEEIATIDLLTGGRLDVGLGRGYQNYEFERLGAAVWIERARAELGRGGGRAREDGLSAAERRVAVLVAAGRTNREVAAQLFLAERTVAGHLTRVYAKLGVRSRTELARRLR